MRGGRASAEARKGRGGKEEGLRRARSGRSRHLGGNALGLSEVDVSRQLPHNHDVDPTDNLLTLRTSRDAKGRRGTWETGRRRERKGRRTERKGKRREKFGESYLGLESRSISKLGENSGRAKVGEET